MSLDPTWTADERICSGPRMVNGGWGWIEVVSWEGMMLQKTAYEKARHRNEEKKQR